MMYQDSIDQAGEKAALAIAFLQRHRLAAHPVNYTVAYDYITGANAGLCQTIEQKLAARIPFDDFVMTELYSNFISTNNKENDQLVNRVSQLVNKLNDTSNSANDAISEYIDILDHSLVALKTENPAQARDTLHRMLDATYDARTSQQKLKDQLQQSHQQAEILREELAQLKRNRQVDPLTGLYNRLAMQEHVDLLADGRSQTKNRGYRG